MKANAKTRQKRNSVLDQCRYPLIAGERLCAAFAVDMSPCSCEGRKFVGIPAIPVAIGADYCRCTACNTRFGKPGDVA